MLTMLISWFVSYFVFLYLLNAEHVNWIKYLYLKLFCFQASLPQLVFFSNFIKLAFTRDCWMHHSYHISYTPVHKIAWRKKILYHNKKASMAAVTSYASIFQVRTIKNGNIEIIMFSSIGMSLSPAMTWTLWPKHWPCFSDDERIANVKLRIHRRVAIPHSLAILFKF